MAPLDTRFSRPSVTALGMGALGVVSVGLISTGLWYDSHRSAQAVERAREQVDTAQTALAPPEPVAVTGRTTSTQPAESDAPRSTVEETEQPPAAVEPESGPGTGVQSPVPTLRPTTPVAAVAPQPVRQATAPTPVAAQATPATTAGGATDATTAEGGGEGGATPSEQEITQPVEPGQAPGGAFPGLFDLVRPFLPQADMAQQAPVAEAGTGAADEGPGLNP